MSHHATHDLATTAPAISPLAINVQPEAPRVLRGLFLSALADGTATHCAITSLSDVEDDGGPPDSLVIAETTSKYASTTLVQLPDCVVLLDRQHSTVQVSVRASKRCHANAGLAEATSWFTEKPPEQDPDRVPVDFWQSGRNGMTGISRSIEVPCWSEIEQHYPDEVREGLASAMQLDLEEVSGRIMLWHGAPGTGKTTAIRALARAWRDEARAQVVLDPESVFTNAANLMEVLLHEPRADKDMWRLLVIEDADEIVRAGSDRTVRSLSRLLNVGDGIVGQGLRVLVLLTTNEPPDRLHPALGRPGRCMSSIGFRPFTRTEARAAFSDRALPDGEHLTLAEILHGTPSAPQAPTGTYL